ncbi:MAG: hypothetical protein HY912_12760 [Desulfomonile tiedjei]|uniref:Response regulatory domain-containing protein n=1 Tax=Desulfomonile tiedjei TaxID=2358 RepID=A0A9D6V1Y4_9BACT|nr:hypothetical protein [Desulfomonile tiedjei]
MSSVIVFDEEMDSCNLLKRILEREGHGVTTCSHSEETLRLVSSNPPDLVIAHISQSKSMKLAAQIKSVNSKLKVLTICDHVSDVVESAMGDGYLIRPVDIETIESKVRELLAPEKRS